MGLVILIILGYIVLGTIIYKILCVINEDMEGEVAAMASLLWPITLVVTIVGFFVYYIYKVISFLIDKLIILFAIIYLNTSEFFKNLKL